MVDVNHAFSFIEPPYKLVHRELTAEWTGTLVDTQVMYITMPKYYGHPGPGSGSLLNSDVYDVERYKFEGTLYYGQSYPGTIRTWGRGAPSIGMQPPVSWVPYYGGSSLSQYYPIYRNANWDSVLAWTDNSVTVRTYLYKIRPHGTADAFDWIPGYTPNDLKFALSLIHTIPVSVEHIPEIGFHLSPIYPTPSRGETKIAFSLERTSPLSFALYDVFGRKVMTIAQPQLYTPGSHVLQFEVSTLPSGTYFLTAFVNDKANTQKLVVFH